MREERIAEIGIDDEGRLYVQPDTMSFEHIYRAAKQVNWDANQRRLFGPAPRDWSYLDWFKQIAQAVAEEYHTRITLTSDTIWSSVPRSVRDEIGSLSKSE